MAAPSQRSKGKGGGRYAVVSVLWKTPHGSAYIARDRQRGMKVVLEQFNDEAWQACDADAKLKELTERSDLMPPIVRSSLEGDLFIVSAMPVGPTLDELKRLSEDETWDLADQMVAQMRRLHNSGFIHGALTGAAVVRSPGAAVFLGPGTVAFHSAGGNKGEALAESIKSFAPPELPEEGPSVGGDFFALGRLLEKVFRAGEGGVPSGVQPLIDKLSKDDRRSREVTGVSLRRELNRLRPKLADKIRLASGVSVIGALALLALALLVTALRGTAGEPAQKAASPRKAGPRESARETPARTKRRPEESGGVANALAGISADGSEDRVVEIPELWDGEAKAHPVDVGTMQYLQQAMVRYREKAEERQGPAVARHERKKFDLDFGPKKKEEPEAAEEGEGDAEGEVAVANNNTRPTHRQTQVPDRNLVAKDPHLASPEELAQVDRILREFRVSDRKKDDAAQLRALSRYPDPRVSRAVVDAATPDSDRNYINEAIVHVLQAHDTPEATRQMIDLMARYPVTQGVVTEALGKLNNSKSVELLCNYGLTRVSDGAARAGVTAAIAQVGGSKVVPYLRRALQDRDVRVRATAAEALGRMRAKDAAGDLMALTNSRSVPDRTAALEALTELGHEDAYRAMVDALSARSPKVRRAGIAGLLALRKPESVPVLIKHLRAEPTALRGDCIKALAYITGKNFEDDTSKWSSWWRENKENFVPASTSAGAMAWRQSKAGVTFCGIRSYSRRMIFVIDASGSAAGRLSGLAGSLEKALSDASPQHMFNIICYDNNVSKLQPGLIPVAPATISQAKAWLEGREPNGKRNIFSALNVALRDPHVDTIFLVAFDGPNDGKKGRAIFDEVRKRNELRGVVIHAIGRGKAEDFLRKLAAENGGEYQTQ